MKTIFLCIPFVFFLFSCDNPMEVEQDENLKNAVLETDNAFVNVTDSTDKMDSLQHFQYQNLTVWGGIESWYKENEIVKIRTTARGELGFIRTTHFYDDGSNYKSVQINRTPNWKEFEEKYGQMDSVNDPRMTYTDDTTETVTHYSVLDSFDLQMIQEAGELMIFVSNENK